MAKILVVEDDKALAKMVGDWLRRENHMVEFAFDGREAEQALQLSSFDLIILDWDLPFVTGIEVCKAFRNDGGDTAVLMLTGKSDICEKETGLDAGADDYLTKPFNVRELAARVRALLRRTSSTKNQLLVCGPISLNPSSGVVLNGVDEVRLAPREFALLEFFMRHQDEIFSADALIQRVWQSDSEATANALATSIKRIRAKLDKDEGNSVITTVTRVGYKMESKRPPLQNRRSE